MYKLSMFCVFNIVYIVCFLQYQLKWKKLLKMEETLEIELTNHSSTKYGRCYSTLKFLVVFDYLFTTKLMNSVEPISIAIF
jgi:hypothetical protein